MKSNIRLPKAIPFTKDGYEKLQTDFDLYTKKRIGAVISLRTAREMGDLSENGAYKAARFELSDIDRQLRRLKFLIRFGVVVKKQNKNVVDFGCRITLDDGRKKMSFNLVGGYESNPAEDKLSIHSPIGQAILQKKLGDKVSVHAPSGDMTYTIVEIN